MRLSFDGYLFDAARRELRHRGRLVEMQPRMFDLLAYLIEHRDRVVGRDELRGALWSDTLMSTDSLQRAVRVVRTALDCADGDTIRTYRHGYRFVADVEADLAGGTPPPVPAGQPMLAAFTAPPRFVHHGEVRLAWRALGHGEPDLLMIPGWSFPMSAWMGLPRASSLCSRLSLLGRLLLFDRRGVGLSDPVEQAPSLAERMEDARVVLDAARSARAVIVGIGEGAPLALLLAATHPGRVAGLVLVGAFARVTAAPDTPWGWSRERIEALRAYIVADWGAGDTIRAMAPRHAGDADLVRWAAAAEQSSTNPDAALDLFDMNLVVDARPIVSSVHVPSVVLHQRDDAVVPVGCGRDLARHLPRCRYVEVDGDDHAFLYDGTDVLLSEVALLIESARRGEAPEDRLLATALVAKLGADPEPLVLEALLRRFGATVVALGAGRMVACFDRPARALHCAAALRDAIAAPASVAIHIGEIAREGSAVRGPALDHAASIAESTAPGDIRVSRVLADVVGPSDHAFDADGAVGAISVLRVVRRG